MDRLSAAQAELFAKIRNAGPKGLALSDGYGPLLKLVEYGLVVKERQGSLGHSTFVFVDPGAMLRAFVDGGLMTGPQHKRFLLAWGYIEWTHGMWCLTNEGNRVATTLGWL